MSTASLYPAAHNLVAEVVIVLGWIYTLLVAASIMVALLLGRGAALSGAVVTGAQKGLELALGMAGAICLWSGVGRLMEKAGFTAFLVKLFRPVLHRLFPESRQDPTLAGALSSNICANFLGLGNAATPMGIQAARRLAGDKPVASDSLCRLIVLNTASIQLIPATVAAIRSSLGSSTPFDILPAVWVTSACSAGLGLGAAWILGKVWKDG